MGMAKWLFDFFCAAADREKGEWTGSLRMAAEQTGIPLWTVKRYMGILKKGNYIDANRSHGGITVRVKKYKTIVRPEGGTPSIEEIGKDERTPLEKNVKSKLYIPGKEELQNYFKEILKKAHLSNHDTYVLLRMYWDKIPLVVIKNTVEELLAKSKKKIFTVRYFKKAIYENHRKYTHRLEPEKELMSKESIDKKEKFHSMVNGVAKEKNHGTEEII